MDGPSVIISYAIGGFIAVLLMGALAALNVKVFGTLEYWFSSIKVFAILGFILLGAYLVFGSRKEGGSSRTTRLRAASSRMASPECGSP